MDDAEKKSIGALVGAVIGFHVLFGFTFIARPATWLFVDWGFSRAVIAYGYLCTVVMAACIALGAFAPSIWKRISK